MSTDLDWLIVGGGIHGVHLATRLLAEAGVAPKRLRLLDPSPRLLATWQRCTANTGMRFLRSPSVHHLDPEPWSLLYFAGAHNSRGHGAPEGSFTRPYNRPSLDLFARHCDDVIARYGLADLHIRDRAVGVDLSCDSAVVRTDSGEALETRNVLLALGASERPRWPAWARELARDGHRIEHIFGPDQVLDPDDWPDTVAVIGGGISAAQGALRLAEAGRSVHLVTRHPLRKHQFDSDPGWLGPKHMRRFLKTRDLARRRAMITEARHTGSVPPDVLRDLRRALADGRVVLHQGDPRPTQQNEELLLHVDGQRLAVGGVLLATGFEGGRPGGSLVDELVTSHALPCAGCGFPIVDKHLRWHPAVYVTGPLAELEVGPASRHIVGARRSGSRIVPAARPAG